MDTLNLQGINPVVARRVGPFFDEILRSNPELVHSLHLVGSAATEDFRDKQSDINAVVVLTHNDFSFLRHLGTLGKRYRKERIAAPLIMTPEMLRRSLNVFPMECLDLKMIHRTVFGLDILTEFTISPSHLRIQCEREVTTRLIGLRQGYISSLGEKAALVQVISRSITGCMPLFRAILHLLGKESPVRRADVVKSFEALFASQCRGKEPCVRPDVFERVVALKHREYDPTREEIHVLFEDYYFAVDIIGRFIDELPS